MDTLLEDTIGLSSSDIVIDDVYTEGSSLEWIEKEPDENSDVEPIAIIGMGCKLPGGANSPSQLWDLLVNGRSGQCDIPKERFNADTFYHPKGPDRPGSMHTKGGYFLNEDIRAFENSFFGINNLEATYMDPQQRKLLEVVFECFESAGARLEDVSGSNIGCYVGSFAFDFQTIQTRDPEYTHRYSATGMGTTLLGNRISHVFNLQGPSLVLDTACSSSLYCLHTAVMALRNRECDAAIVAGANLIQSAEQYLGLMKAGVLSSTSTCHVFDSSADGYGRADGVAALYVKRLSDAIRDGDPIRSVIRGSAVNSNGRTPGITLPSAKGQEAVIRKAHAAAGLDLKETVYVECHGTGTPVGDPIEVEAVSRAFGDELRTTPLLIGSVKTNLGHSEATSGISSIIKVVLALEKGLIPSSIGVRRINPKIKTHEWNVEIVTRNTAWPHDPRDLKAQQRAGVNSFGYGGANAHVVLEAADRFLPADYQKISSSKESVVLENKKFLLPFSASSEKSLASRVAALPVDRLVLADLAYTLSSRRSKLPVTGFLIASQNSINQDLQVSNLQTQVSTTSSRPESPFAFVFTGQGAQWAQMGKGLIENFPVVQASIQRMDSVLQALPHPPSWKISDILTDPPETSKVNDVTFAQPASTAIQIALIDILAQWNIRPKGVVGHSSGETAAAYAAGLITAAQAITIAYYRGYTIGKSASKGQMMAVGLSQAEVQEEITGAGLSGRIVVACVNSPVSVTVSGDADAIDLLFTALGSTSVFRRKLVTGGRAYHSHHMTSIGEEYESLLHEAFSTLDESERLPTGVHFVSSVTMEPLTSPPSVSYWRSNLESPVLFSQALQVLQMGRNFQLIELGPHSALKLPITQIRKHLGIAEADLPYLSALSRGDNDSAVSLLKLMGQLFMTGASVALHLVNSPSGTGDSTSGRRSIGTVVKDLPTYQWTYDQILWSESRLSNEFRHRKYPRHELLGSRVVGGNGTDASWRNILHVRDAPWLGDYRLEQQSVLPATAYMAMAIEALQQMTGEGMGESESVELRHVHILNALVLPTQDQTPGVEIFTSLQRQRLSSKTKSPSWWNFEIVSHQDDASVIHASGTIQSSFPADSNSDLNLDQSSMEPSAVRNWYDGFIQAGLNFGPEFQPIKGLHVHRKRTLTQAIAEVSFLQQAPGANQWDSKYVVHPITLDSMLQTALIAATGGIISKLRAQVPVTIEHAVIRGNPSPSAAPSTPYQVHAQAKSTGFGITGSSADLCNKSGQICAQLRGVRLVSYEGAAGGDGEAERHPMLRVIWRPDLYGLGLVPAPIFSAALEKHQPAYLNEHRVGSEITNKILATADLIAHKNPRLRILQLELPSLRKSGFTQSLLATLRSHTPFPRYSSFTIGYLETTDAGIVFKARDIHRAVVLGESDLEGILDTRSIEAVFDLIVIPHFADINLDGQFDAISNLLAPQGLLLISSIENKQFLNSPKVFSGTTSSALGYGDGHVVLAQKHAVTPPKSQCIPDLILVETETDVALGDAIVESFAHTSISIKRTKLDNVSTANILPSSTVIVTIETRTPFLSTVSDAQMSLLKVITDNASAIIWVTGTGLFNCKLPDTALVSGLSRSLMLEQPSLRFFTLDIDGTSSPDVTAGHIVDILRHADTSDSPDFEYVEHQSLIHISRFVPDELLNEKYQHKQGTQPIETTLEHAEGSELFIQSIGQFNTVCFKQNSEEKGPLDPDEVEIELKSVGLNEKDVSVLSGKLETKNATVALEYSGLVKSVGSSVTDISPGDRVVVMAPNHFKLVERAPQWACEKMNSNEGFHTMATLCVAYTTALYGLHHRGQLKRGETVLIHSGAGGVGLAAIQVAKLAGAKIFTTVSTKEKRDYLVETFGLCPDHIFSSRDSSFLQGVLTATNGRGVDVVLNSLTRDLLHDSWQACAEFGRFVEIGRRDIDDAGSLDMQLFSRNVTFTAFDMSALFYNPNPAFQNTWSGLMKEAIDMYRSGKIKISMPLKVFDVSQLADAYRYFTSKDRIGKVAISVEDATSRIKVLPLKHDTKFSAEKSYLLVGCLGGLGRALTKWMRLRGARKFVFLSRSGRDKLAAQNLIDDLQAGNALVTVLRGDVSNLSDVQKAVDAIPGVLGGVIHAAMGLDESLFTTMSGTAWHTGIDPKVQGAWNLHNAVAKREASDMLDFFLMTSSISGSMGAATESNYCAANYFLDVFSRYRRGKGLRATTIGLGVITEVGYVHENPEVEGLLLRRGLQSFKEDELIQIVDLALSGQNPGQESLSCDPLASAHILTGLEPLVLKGLRQKGLDGTNPLLNEPRATLLSGALDDDPTANRLSEGNSAVSTELAVAIRSGGAEKTLREVIVDLFIKRFSNLILISPTKIDVAKPLAAFGMDSMLAAEFRTWIYHVFKIDIPFLELLSKSVSIVSLVNNIQV